MKNALIEAMDKQRAFSWVKTKEVQAGVYLEYSQQFYHTYILK